MKNLLLGILVLATGFAYAQRKGEGDTEIHKSFQSKLSSLQTVAIVSCESNKKAQAYFYSVDGQPIVTQKSPEEVTKIALLPGEHEVKMKFRAKGELPMTVDSFTGVNFEKGREYMVKMDYKPGRGEYPTSTYTARLRMWIIDEEDGNVLAEKIVNGKGDLVAGN